MVIITIFFILECTECHTNSSQNCPRSDAAFLRIQRHSCLATWSSAWLRQMNTGSSYVKKENFMIKPWSASKFMQDSSCEAS